MIHLLLPITLYRPEEMRVIEEYQNDLGHVLYLLQTYSPKSGKWLNKADFFSLDQAMLFALDSYSTFNVYEVDKVREKYKGAEIQIVDNLKWSL